MTTDRLSGIALGLFALFAIWESRALPFGSFRQPGPAYAPVLFSSLLLLCAVFVALAGGRARSLSSVSWTEWRHAVAIIGASAFSVFALERLGYRVTVILVLVFLLRIVERRSWLLSLVFASALSLASFFLFYSVLRVPLPIGPFGF